MQQYRQQFSSMGCPCEIRLYAAGETMARHALTAAIEEIGRLNSKYSLYRDDSLLADINRSAGSGKRFVVDEETAALLDYAEAEYILSDGLFDITAGALWRTWDLRAKCLPADELIAEALRLTGWSKLDWSRPSLLLPNAGMALDLGGIAKEYAADRAAVILRRYGINHGLVDLGGDMSVVGPHLDGQGWSVGIKDPANPQEAIALIKLKQGGLASSGDYERCIVIDGVKYSHIINPLTGWPVQGLASVSVQASSCLAAGAISTVAMLKGKVAGHGFLRNTGLAWMSIDHDGLVTTSQPESTTYVTPGSDLPSPDGHLAGRRPDGLGCHPV